jgi:membrane associated rhomboid family serine protease
MAYHQRAYGSFGFGYGLTPVVKRLLLVNVAVFFVTWVVGLGIMTDVFAFQPRYVLTRPWGFVTYMFVHGGFMHVFVNMLALFFFGPPLEAKWGGREFLRFYAIAGMGAVALGLVFAPNAAVIGASGAVYGVMLAFAMNWPEAPIWIWGIFPVQAKWLVGFFFLVSLFGAFDPSAGGGVAHFAHLGGLATAFLYLKADWWPSDRLKGVRKATRKVRRLAIVPRDEAEESSEDKPIWAQDDQRRLLDAVDRVLDKISEQGMASLTAEERRLLDEVSRRHRTN